MLTLTPYSLTNKRGKLTIHMQNKLPTKANYSINYNISYDNLKTIYIKKEQKKKCLTCRRARALQTRFDCAGERFGGDKTGYIETISCN